MKITDERHAEMVGAGVPCVPAQPGEIAAVVQELRALRAASITPPAPEHPDDLAVDRLEIAESQVQRLTEDNEALRVALGNMRCPRPCNHRPDEFDAKDCVTAGECGCGAAILSGVLNAPS